MRQFQQSAVVRWSPALRHIPIFFLALALALALGIIPAPTMLLAAPAAQESGPAVVGYYESDLIPGSNDTPDYIVQLILYEDGSAEVVTVYQNDQDIITEVGTWVDNGDGTLTLTVTGTSDGDYAAPIDLDFNVGEDGTLVAPSAGELTLMPATRGNSEAILAQIPADALVYQSDVLPATSSPGQQLTLALFDDGSLTLVSDYLNEGEIVVEIGTWSENEDGNLVITLTGQIENADGTITEYEEALELIFAVSDDNSLVLTGESSALFGDAGLTLFPIEATGEATGTETDTGEDAAEATPEATEEAAAEETTPEATEEATTEEGAAEATPEPSAEATGTVTDTVTVTETVTDTVTTTVASAVTETVTVTGTVPVTAPSGVYISDLLPSDDGDGTFIVTVFHDDGSVYFSTYPLNGEPPITEVGIWAAQGSGAYMITATGTLSEEYDQPFEVEFTVDEEGLVTISGVPLYPLAEINLAGAPIVVAEFQSDVITDTIELAHTLTLVAYDDFSAELITEYATADGGYTEYGEWGINEATDQLTLTLTSDDDVVYAEPIVWVFDITADDTLVLANDEEGYYGEDGLTLFALQVEEGAMGEEAAADDITGDAATGDAATDDATAGEEATSTEDTATGDAATEEEAATGDEATASDETTGAEATGAEGAQLFQSEVLPAASSPGLQLTLGLLDDGSAALDYDYMNDEEVVTNLGEWVDNGDGTITITFTEGPNGVFELPVEITLQLDDEGNFVIIDASEESSGLVDVVLAPVVLE